MKKAKYSMWFLACGVLSLQLYAQPSDLLPSQQSPQQSGQDQRAKQQPGDPPDQSAQPSGDARPQTPVQIFTGTIAKSGEKFVLQESSGGNTYDIDRQDIVKDLEGKKVRVHGILDPDGKTIHVQQGSRAKMGQR